MDLYKRIQLSLQRHIRNYFKLHRSDMTAPLDSWLQLCILNISLSWASLHFKHLSISNQNIDPSDSSTFFSQKLDRINIHFSLASSYLKKRESILYYIAKPSVSAKRLKKNSLKHKTDMIFKLNKFEQQKIQYIIS